MSIVTAWAFVEPRMARASAIKVEVARRRSRFIGMAFV
jgi:hypothetical protein